MNDNFIATRNYQRYSELCKELSSTYGVDMAAVTGRAGRGKSTAAYRIFSQQEHPCIYVVYQGGWSHSALLREIVFKVSGTRPRFRQDCDELIERELSARQKIVMVDNADRMPLICFDVLRNIHDMEIPVMLIGEDLLLRKLQRERWLISRVRRILDFEPATQADVVVLFKKITGKKILQEQAVKILKRADGDFRPVVVGAVAAETAMRKSGVDAVTDGVMEIALSEMAKIKDRR